MKSKQIKILKTFTPGTLYSGEALKQYGKGIFAFFHRGVMPEGALIMSRDKEVYYLNVEGVKVVKS